jgi:SAM-dependent methyltransferase
MGMELQRLQAEFDQFRCDATLSQPHNLAGRAKALAFAAYMRQLARARRNQPELVAFAQTVARQANQWRELDQAVISEVRRNICTGNWRGDALRQVLDRYTAYRATAPGQPHFDYDGLDLLLRGVFEPEPIPDETQPRGPEMVHLERTPARAILELIDRVQPTPGDIFYDLGAGLGMVVFLVQLLTGMAAKGVEIEPAYCAYAQRQVQSLGLSAVAMIQGDASLVDLGDGTIFFLFTPFTGGLFQRVLDRLHAVAQHHPITLGAYGACARRMAQQPWLLPQDDHADHEYKVAIFRSQVG